MKLRTATLRGLVDHLLVWFNELESQAGLSDGEKRRVTPTIEFLESLARHCAGVFHRPFSTTEAWALWRLVYAYADRLRCETAELADLAAVYSCNPWELSQRQRVALRTNIPRVKAQRILEAGNYDPTNYRLVYSLVLLATGDEHQAQRAQTEALQRYVDMKTRRSD